MSKLINIERLYREYGYTKQEKEIRRDNMINTIKKIISYGIIGNETEAATIWDYDSKGTLARELNEEWKDLFDELRPEVNVRFSVVSKDVGHRVDLLVKWAKPSNIERLENQHDNISCEEIKQKGLDTEVMSSLNRIRCGDFCASAIEYRGKDNFSIGDKAIKSLPPKRREKIESRATGPLKEENQEQENEGCVLKEGPNEEPCAPDARVEALADYAHEAWSGWMRYLFSKTKRSISGDETIPADLVARWARQMVSPYRRLSEEEKQSDRKEAHKILELLSLRSAACLPIDQDAS